MTLLYGWNVEKKPVDIIYAGHKIERSLIAVSSPQTRSVFSGINKS